MKIHEYQAKEIFRSFCVPVPEGVVARSAEEALAAAQRLSPPVVVKAQIHAGGRGKGKIYRSDKRSELILDGGVKLVQTAEEARATAAKILGNMLVTLQTGPQGKKVGSVLVEKACAIAREYYVGLTLDRKLARVVLMGCAEGGMDIEDVAKTHPEKILKASIDPAEGLIPDQARRLGLGLGLTANFVGEFSTFCLALAKLYHLCDAQTVEVNPLAQTKEGKFLALDAKVVFDDNALFRHKEFLSLRDLNEEDAQEIEASQHDLSYISLNGNIGCMVNGAGLAMATMDIIKLYGGEPANFLDVGGGASAEKVSAAFKIILKDPKVKAILVNIFGGIMRCDVIAEGIVAAVKEVGLCLPLVVRLQGTNVEKGRKILQDSGLTIIAADTMADAAQKVVKAISTIPPPLEGGG